MLAPLQQQVNSFWQHQSKPQRITLVALVLTAVILIPLFLSWANTPSYSVAFSNLSETDAGSIVEALDAAGIDYQLKNDSTILVPSDQVYEVRLQMANEGLPSDSSVGYEIFDSSSLGMTEFTQQVNYQRALEGELERTIGSLDAIEAVRVHIVTPEESLLSEDQEPTTASITIQYKSGQALNQSQVKAISHLVASAVEGLDPANVVIVDTEGNMLASGNGENSDNSAAAATDSYQAAENAAAEGIQNKVQSLLDSVLGPNKSVVQANVVMDWTQKETTSQTFNPTPAAVSSSQITTETYTTNGTTTGGVAGAASNLPTPVATTTGTSGVTDYNKTEEIYSYQISQTQSHEISATGTVKKVSLSVMVDGITDQGQLDIIRSAVAAAAGIDDSRGDVLSVESLAFDRSYYQDEATAMEEETKTQQYIQIAEIAGGVILLALLLWYVSRLMKNLRLASAEAWIPVMQPVTEAALGAGMPSGLPGMPSANQPALQKKVESGQAQEPEFTLPKVQAPNAQDEQMQRVLTRMAEENPANVAEIIQLWLNEDEGKRG